MTLYKSLLKPGKSKNKAALEDVRDGRMASRNGPKEGKTLQLNTVTWPFYSFSHSISVN